MTTETTTSPPSAFEQGYDWAKGRQYIHARGAAQRLFPHDYKAQDAFCGGVKAYKDFTVELKQMQRK